MFLLVPMISTVSRFDHFETRYIFDTMASPLPLSSLTLTLNVLILTLAPLLKTLMSLDLDADQMDLVWSEADLDKNGSISFAEAIKPPTLTLMNGSSLSRPLIPGPEFVSYYFWKAVCLLNPAFTSKQLKDAIPEFRDPAAHIKVV